MTKQVKLSWPVTAENVLSLAKIAAQRPPHPTTEQCRPVAAILSGLGSAKCSREGSFVLPAAEAFPKHPADRKRLRDAIDHLMTVLDSRTLAHPISRPASKALAAKIRLEYRAENGIDLSTSSFINDTGRIERNMKGVGVAGHKGSGRELSPLIRLRESLIRAKPILLPPEFDARLAIWTIHDAAQEMFVSCGRQRTKATRNSVVAIFIEQAMLRIGLDGFERETIANYIAKGRLSRELVMVEE